MRRGLIIIFAIILALFTFSENEVYKKDIRNRLVIQGVGIDLEEDGTYSVTLQAIDTNSSEASSAEGASQPPLKAYKLTGDTVYTAIKSVNALIESDESVFIPTILPSTTFIELPSLCVMMNSISIVSNTT